MTFPNLLMELFNVDELQAMLLEFLPDSDTYSAVNRSIPWKNAILLPVTLALVEGLERHKLIQRGLFIHLAKLRPRRVDEIAAVYEEFFGRRFSWISEEEAALRDFSLKSILPALDSSGRALLDQCADHVRCEPPPEGGGAWDISTKTVFQVYRTRHPWVAFAFDGVLPNPDRNWTRGSEDVLESNFSVSRCTRLTLTGLARFKTRAAPVTDHDVFLDLARFGAGESVDQMRKSGVGIDRINSMSRELDIGRVTRHGPID